MIELPPLLERARATGDWSGLLDAIPFSRWLNLSAAITDDALITTMGYSDRLIGNYSIAALHGGAIAGLLEAAAIFALVHSASELKLPRIINLTVEYLRSGKARDTYATADITKLGRRVAMVRAYAWQEKRAEPIALAHAHFLLAAEEPPDR